MENQQKGIEITVPKYINTIELPSGSKLGILRELKGKDVRKATKLAGNDSSKIMFALISLVCEVDGNAIVMEDIDEMPGMDVFKMMEIFDVPN